MIERIPRWKKQLAEDPSRFTFHCIICGSNRYTLLRDRVTGIGKNGTAANPHPHHMGLMWFCMKCKHWSKFTEYNSEEYISRIKKEGKENE